MDAGFSNSCFTSRSDSAASSGSTTKTSISPHHRSGFSSLQGSTQGLDNIRAPLSKLTLSKLSTRTRERADESNKGTNKSDDDTKCARCSSRFFINLKLPCGRVVFLCPNCTADFRVHLGQKISEVLLRPFCEHICNFTRACACTRCETRQPKRRSMVMVRCHTDGTKAVRKQRRQKKRKALRACKRSKHGTSGGSRASRLCATIRQHKGSARGLEHCT